MADPRWVRRPRGYALAQVTLAALAAGLVEALLLAASPYGPLWATLLFVVGAEVHAAAGIAALWRRPHNRLGSVLLAGSGAWLLAGLYNCGIPSLEVIGALAQTLPLAIVVHLLHAFPGGRLTGRASRFVVVTGYIVYVVNQVPQVVFLPGPLEIAFHPRLASAGSTARTVTGLLIMVSTAILLQRRLGEYDAAQRRVVVPLLTYGTLAAIFVSLSGRPIGGWFGLTSLQGAVTQLFLVMGVPVAFAVVLLRGGFARAGQLDELLVWFSTNGLSRPVLADALAGALGDPSAQLLYRTGGGYADRRGTPVALPEAGSAGLVPVTLDGRTVGVITYDTRLTASRETAIAAADIIAVAVDYERITAELLASEVSLRLAAVRAVEAAEQERRRIAQDLHDGLQADLVLLAIQANNIATSTDHVRESHDLRVRLVAAAADLAAFVNGVMPATLVERGLFAAVEDLADRLPIQTIVSAGPNTAADLPASVESSAYFVVAEALANAVKHSGAEQMQVHFERVGDLLRIEIVDDGVGGAAATSGLGMTGIGDRVGVLGGRVEVSSPPGSGTRMLLELPCAS